MYNMLAYVVLMYNKLNSKKKSENKIVCGV